MERYSSAPSGHEPCATFHTRCHQMHTRLCAYLRQLAKWHKSAACLHVPSASVWRRLKTPRCLVPTFRPMTSAKSTRHSEQSLDRLASPVRQKTSPLLSINDPLLAV